MRFDTDRITVEAAPKAGGASTTCSVEGTAAASPRFFLGLPLADGAAARVFIDDVVVHR